MSFLNIAIWPMLALGAIPLIIHLLTRRPPRPLEFAPIGLLRRALRRQERRMRLRRWLLLALRTAWVVCLLLAVLQPQWGQPAAAVDGDRSSLAIVIDSSGSMDTKGADGDRFYDRAIALAQAQADRRPVSLFRCAAKGLQTLVAEPRSGINVRSELGEDAPMGVVSLSACAASLPASALVLTDGWSRFAGEAPMEIVAKAGEGIQNWGFGEVSLSRRGGNSYKLRVEVVGQPGVRRVEALIDGKARAATRVTVPASGRAFAQLTLGLKPGRYGLELQLPADSREADNRRQMILHASGPTRLIAINGDARDSAYADELYYVQQAERALDHHDPFTLEAVVAGEEHRAPLQDSDVVLLANIAKLDPGFSQALTSFVRGGGGLLISVGANTDALELQRSLGALLPAQVRARWAAKDAEGNPSKSAALQAAAPQTEWLKAVGLQAGGGLLRTRIWQGLNVDASKGVRWRLADGRPLWVEKPFGDGRVALLTTSIDRDHADLAIRPGFVPLLRGALRQLAGDQASQLSPSILPGQVWAHPLEVDDAVFRRLDGGVIRAQIMEDQLQLEPTSLGLWQQRDQGLAVELRTDPLESQPHTQDTESRAVQASGAQHHVPLWPWLLFFGMLFLGAESLVLLSDHKARAA